VRRPDNGRRSLYTISLEVLLRSRCSTRSCPTLLPAGNDCTNHSGTVTAPAANKNLIAVMCCGAPAVTFPIRCWTAAEHGGFSFTRAYKRAAPRQCGHNAVTSSPIPLDGPARHGFPRMVSGTVDIGAYESTSGCSTITLSPAVCPMAHRRCFTTNHRIGRNSALWFCGDYGLRRQA